MVGQKSARLDRPTRDTFRSSHYTFPALVVKSTTPQYLSPHPSFIATTSQSIFPPPVHARAFCSLRDIANPQIIPISYVETEVSLWSYEPEIRAVIDWSKENKIPILAYSPLGRGFITRKWKSPEDVPPNSFQAMSPRFQGEAFYENLKIVDELDRLAGEKGLETSQLALAWVVGLSPYVGAAFRRRRRRKCSQAIFLSLFLIEQRNDADTQVIPIPGSSNAKRVKQNTEAADIKLTDEDLKVINKILEEFEPKGGRYPDHSSGLLVSGYSSGWST